MNPKDAAGRKKPDLSLVPPTALREMARAMGDGASKYGAYNWRDHPVLARVYVAAAMRHLGDWLDGEELAQDSGVHHLAHAMANMAILLDAQAHQCLADDRPKNLTTDDVVSSTPSTNPFCETCCGVGRILDTIGSRWIDCPRCCKGKR